MTKKVISFFVCGKIGLYNNNSLYNYAEFYFVAFTQSDHISDETDHQIESEIVTYLTHRAN